MTRATSKHKQLVTHLTVDDLRKMIKEIVRQVVREEAQRGYYINKDGYKVLYAEEPVAPDYARELNETYQAIVSGNVELVSGEQAEKELREMGVPI